MRWLGHVHMYRLEMQESFSKFIQEEEEDREGGKEGHDTGEDLRKMEDKRWKKMADGTN